MVDMKFNTQKAEQGKGEVYVCPVTNKEIGPKNKAVYLVPCGDVFSEAAIREVKEDVCLQCNAPYTEENIISILPTAKEDIERLKTRISALQEAGKTHSLKKAPGEKSKKRKKGVEEATTTPITTAETAKSKPKTTETGSAVSGIKNGATASLTAKVLEEQEERNKRRKMGLNDNLKSLFSSKGYEGSTHKGGDFMTRGFSIPKKT